MFEVIIVGGSYAGLAAALQLGRARRDVLVVDAGRRRNARAAHAYGFLSRDGESPAAIAAKGRAEVLAYSTVRWREGSVASARHVPGGFAVRVGDEELAARRLILATGVTDELPAIPGLAERWGVSALHCPYCHGYELHRGPVGVLATTPQAALFAPLVAEWGAPGGTTLFPALGFAPDEVQRAELAERGIAVEAEPVVALAGDAPGLDVRLAGGRARRLAGLFVVPRTVVPGGFAGSLGLELDVGPTGAYYRTDAYGETNVPGVFACGDVAVPAGAVSIAVGDGVLAGVGAHKSLVFRRE